MWPKWWSEESIKEKQRERFYDLQLVSKESYIWSKHIKSASIFPPVLAVQVPLIKPQASDWKQLVPAEEQWGIHQRCCFCKKGNLSNQRQRASISSLLGSTGWKHNWWSRQKKKKDNSFTCKKVLIYCLQWQNIITDIQ